MEEKIRVRLTTLYRAYIYELTINPEVAERYLERIHGYRMGLEEVLNKEKLEPIFESFPMLWEDYDED